ncbi:hypothetical protein [Gallaecimonas sp. GXIMD4217]|uniref:hypothetical protein n=1 Tax=Gallaecimonas sp. GXIMD4217 TaxID=3131927 RepID=UPI00311B3A5A
MILDTQALLGPSPFAPLQAQAELVVSLSEQLQWPLGDDSLGTLRQVLKADAELRQARPLEDKSWMAVRHEHVVLCCKALRRLTRRAALLLSALHDRHEAAGLPLDRLQACAGACLQQVALLDTLVEAGFRGPELARASKWRSDNTELCQQLLAQVLAEYRGGLKAPVAELLWAHLDFQDAYRALLDH